MHMYLMYMYRYVLYYAYVIYVQLRAYLFIDFHLLSGVWECQRTHICICICINAYMYKYALCVSNFARHVHIVVRVSIITDCYM